MYLKLALFLVTFLCGVGLVNAQNIEYGAVLDTNYMMIGDQQHLTFRVKSDAALKVQFPQLKDTVVKGLEIISGPLRDSVKGKDGTWLYQESYVVTAFDTGVYVVPAMPLVVENDSYNNVFRTEPAGVIVNTYQVDEQKGNYDIVMPYDTPVNFAEILPYLLWSLLGIAVILAGIWFFRRYRKNKPLFVQPKEVIPPYVKAIRSLDEIKASKLYQSERVKEYYTRLTDTVRQYLDDEFQIPAMEQTSLETVRAMEQSKMIDTREREKLKDILECADFVKFAKMTPFQDENARYLDAAYEFVNSTNKRLKEEAEKVLAKEQEKKAQEQAEKPEAVR